MRPVVSAETTGARYGAFWLFKRISGHKVVFLENLTSSLFLEEPFEIEEYEQAIRLPVRLALPEEESVRLIKRLAPEATDGGGPHHYHRWRPRLQAHLRTCGFFSRSAFSAFLTRAKF